MADEDDKSGNEEGQEEEEDEDEEVSGVFCLTVSAMTATHYNQTKIDD